MKVKFTEFQKVEGTKKDGSIWTAYKILGTRLEDDNNGKAGDFWKSTNIFDQEDTKELLGQLFSLEAGDKVNVIHAKGRGGWSIKEIKHINDEDIYQGKKSSGGGTRSQGASASGTSKKSDQMSKEEWAEKNRVDSIRIAKSVALKAVVENTKVGTKPEDLIAMADVLVPWLHNVDMGAPSAPVVDDGTDPLDPPA